MGELVLRETPKLATKIEIWPYTSMGMGRNLDMFLDVILIVLGSIKYFVAENMLLNCRTLCSFIIIDLRYSKFSKSFKILLY